MTVSHTILTLIAAIGKNREIGKKNRLLWNLPADLQHFRKTTAGKPVIMGRNTYESIGRPLPDRKNIILSRDHSYRILGAEVIDSLGAAVHLARNCDQDIFIIGGEKIYNQAISFASRLIITHVDAEIPDADAFFPEIDPNEWKVVSQTHHPKDDKNVFAFDIVTYERN